MLDEMKIFNAFLKIFVVASFIIANSCSLCPFQWCSPGYYISIDIHGLQKNIRKEIETVLEEQKYSGVTNEISKSDSVFQYQKIVVKDQDFYHPEVDVIVHFERTNGKNKTGVTIVNRFTGMKPEIKTEMDKLADILYERLLALADKDKIAVTRKPYGPGI
jgi:hypothetical protein